ncbi:MAG: hypothetical protein ABUL66_04660, partial [Verrucomicrobiota bacterium]
CTWISTALFIVFAGLYIYAWIFSPNLYAYPNPSFLHVSLGDVRVAVDKLEGGEIAFFNGPIPNSTTSTGPRNNTTNEKEWAGYGIYFRWIKDVNRPDSWWTLMVSLWYPIILFGILPAIFVVKKWRKRKLVSTKKATIEKCDP